MKILNDQTVYIIIKSDAVQRGLVSKVIQRLKTEVTVENRLRQHLYIIK